MSILSVAFQGTILPYLAQKVNMIDEFSDVRKTFNDYQEDFSIKLLNVEITEKSDWVDKEIKDIKLQQGSLILNIHRGNERIVPKGNTKILLGDSVIMSLPNTNVGDDITLKEIIIDKKHKWCNKKIKELTLPNNYLIVMIKRDGQTIVPNGDITLLEDDLVAIYD